MATKTIIFNGFNRQNKYNQYFIELADNTYIFIVRWNPYDKCAYLTITDYEDEPIIMGRALTSNLIIRNNRLPYIFMFIQKNGEKYDPTIDNIEKEFALVYEDGE